MLTDLALAERWLPIAGFPYHEVSDIGRVRTVPHAYERAWRDRTITQTVRGRIRKLFPNKQRACVCVTLSNAGVISTHKLHHLVLEAFVGPRPPDMVGCHTNGDHEDNALDNLRWDTPASNSADTKRHGRFIPPPVQRGIDNHRTRLTEDDVRAIRAAWAVGASGRTLAERYGVSQGHISGVVTRKYRADIS